MKFSWLVVAWGLLGATSAAASPASAQAARYIASPRQPITFEEAPEAAQSALVIHYQQARQTAYACYGQRLAGFKALLRLVPTDYNGDGRVDYIFQSPCRPPEPLATVRPGDQLLLSTSYGYDVSQQFSAMLKTVNGQPALLVDSACPGQSAADGTCFVGRLWDDQKGVWSGATRVALAPDGAGYELVPVEPSRTR